jgi:hypothetical protein
MNETEEDREIQKLLSCSHSQQDKRRQDDEGFGACTTAFWLMIRFFLSLELSKCINFKSCQSYHRNESQQHIEFRFYNNFTSSVALLFSVTEFYVQTFSCRFNF